MAKVLIVHPDFSRLGGIENYYLKLKPHFQISFESFGNSQRPGESGWLSRIKRIIGDYYRYWQKLSSPELEIVHLNPSLDTKMFYRESLFLLMAKLKRKKTLVFFHGWNRAFEARIDRTRGRLFRVLYGRSDAFIVLANTFAEALKRWGIRKPVYNEVIVINDDVVEQFDLSSTVAQRVASQQPKLLFPSRLLKTKGLDITIKALKLIQETHPEYGLDVAGDGEYLEVARELVKTLDVKHVNFTGILSGNDLHRLFHRANILCFPTQHDEGFPNTIVEAMAFALPVVTRPVGGIADFFQAGEHGYISTSTDEADFAQMLLKIINDVELYRKIAKTNFAYAQNNFLASQATRRLENIYLSL